MIPRDCAKGTCACHSTNCGVCQNHTVRVMVSKDNHGYAYFLNVGASEWLDVCRGLWIMGVTYISAFRGGDCWQFGTRFGEKPLRPGKKNRQGGYSNP